MGSRRLDISSLLCTDQAPPIVPEPVILAPHLRNPRDHNPPALTQPSPPPPRRRSYSNHDAEISRPYPDSPRTQAAPRSIDNLIHPSSQLPPRQHHHHHHHHQQQHPPLPPTSVVPLPQDASLPLPRPSSSSSLSARSPAATGAGPGGILHSYPYPSVHSPVLSPSHSGYTTPNQPQRSSASPFYQPSLPSPLLHRPTSSHSQAPQPPPSQSRHTSQRSRSNTVTAASPTVNLYPLPSPQQQQSTKMFSGGLEALVHAATEERKRLTTTASPVDRSPRRSPEAVYRVPQPTITSPSLATHHHPPPSHASRHRVIQNDDPRPPDDYHHPRPSPAAPLYARPPPPPQQQQQQQQQPPPSSRQQYEDEQRYLMEQRNRLDHQRMLEQQQQWERQREEQRERRLLEQRRVEEQEERERLILLQQQRREQERLQAQQHLVERRRLEEQQRLQELQRLEEQRRKQQQQQQQQEELERQRKEKEAETRRLFEEKRRIEEEREERRRLEEEHRIQEERRRLEEEHRQHEERRRLEEERRRRLEYEERLAAEEHRRRMEERRRLEEESRLEEQKRREEMARIEEQRQHEERQREAAQERQPVQRQQDHRRALSDPVRDDIHRPPLVHPVPPQSAPAVIELPQPVRPYPHVMVPRKSDPIQIKRPAARDTPSPHISTSAPQSTAAEIDQRPAKKQRYSESPPPSHAESSYPRVVALPPPISTEYLPHRPGSSTVRHPGSGQGRRQVLLGLNDAVERERERERERLAAVDAHRIISPLGRRSPPGSQIGRATAAKKSDEARRAEEAAAAAAMADVRKMEEETHVVQKMEDIHPVALSPLRTEPRRVSQEQQVSGPSRSSPVPKIEESIKDASSKMSLDAVMNNNNAKSDVSAIKKEPLPSASLDSRPSSKETDSRSPRDERAQAAVPAGAQSSSNKPHETGDTKDASSQQTDPHEWLLDHYAQSPPPTTQLPPEPPRSLSPSISPVLVKSQPEKSTPTPPSAEVPEPVIALRSVSPDADAVLERELAELMAEEDESTPAHTNEPDDMDIDLAVAETLEEDDKSKVVPMEVDDTDEVEDELLSLVDDRPPPPSSRKVGTPTIPPPAFKPPPPLKTEETKHVSSPAPAPAPPLSATSPIVRSSSTLPALDRGSMPPPSAAPRGKDKEEEVVKKGDSVSVASAHAGKKKKETGNKATAKSKSATTGSANAQTASSNNKSQKAKATATKKAKADTATTNGLSALTAPNVEVKSAAKHAKSWAANKRSTAGGHIAAASRSRSTSVIPPGPTEPDAERKSEEKEDEEEAVDDKLYCVCKTKYDEERFMIACDRCDEWYHTTCVNMPDLEVELVDQFFCPPCIEQNPQLNLKTTYKQRCLNGLRHADPDSPKACHKPARGAISKYCSDECGVKYMQSRIDAWAKKGGKKEELWESVKNAEKREGIAVCVDEKFRAEVDKKKKKQTKTDRETERLQGLLKQVVKMREEIKSSMDVLVWREQLLQLASGRAEHIDQCGWDQRLCFGDEEWQDFGPGVLETYDDVKAVKDENGMQVEDGDDEGEWWCPGQKSCKRHNGWQTLRYKDICKEREKKEELLAKVTTRERQLRKRIEDLTDPSGRKSNDSTSQVPVKSSNTKLFNGHTKAKGVTETLKKGKKRKAPAS